MSTAPFAPTSTSQEAAEAVGPDTATMRQSIQRLVAQRGLQGATRTEIEDFFGLQPQTASARLWELETRSTKPAAVKVRAVQPRKLFRVDKGPQQRVARPSSKSGSPQLVYFSYDVVTPTQVMRHYGIGETQ